MPESTRSRRLVIAAATSLLLTIAVAVAWALYAARESEIEDWREQLSNTTLLLAQQASNEVLAADLLLEGMAERIRARHIEDPAALRRLMSSREVFDDLVGRKKALAQIDVATITDDTGKIVNFSRSYPAPDIDLSDRDYFQAQRPGTAGGAFISVPVRNRGNGEWTFYLSRRISASDGRFLGVVLVGLSSRSMSDFFSKINLGKDAAVTLYRRDFTALARWPHEDALLGKVNRSGTTYAIIEEARRDNGVIILDTPRQADGGRPGRRMGAARLVPNYPLIINVTITEELFMREWRTYAWQLATMGVLCSGAVVLVFWVLLRATERRERAIRRQQVLQTEADAANRAKSDFLAMISHEIRTPLTSVIGFAEQIPHARSLDEAVELAGIIARNGSGLLGLINDILDMSKMESGSLVVERIPFAPRDMLAAVQTLMAGQAEARAVRFETRLAPDAPALVLGDPTRWRQIVLNLVSNAIKFTERGSVDVDVWYEAASERLHCRVRDTGIGMDRQQIERLFKPFEQADKSIARRFGGTGLGLYLVRQLAYAMDGEVAVDSTPGAGTRITVAVRAPVAQAPAVPRPDEPAAPPPPKLRGRVLLVEDSEDNRRLVTAMLQRLGLEVCTAENGQRGIEAAAAMLPDLVLMDIQMPVLDGFEAMKALQGRGFGTRVIALTANVMAQDRARYEAAGFAACLAKPVERGAFERVLRQYLPQVSPEAPLDDLPGFADIRRSFVRSLGPRLGSMRDSLERGVLDEVRHLAHTLKGSAASFGFPHCGLAAADLERACRGADPAAARKALDVLKEVAREEIAASKVDPAAC